MTEKNKLFVKRVALITGIADVLLLLAAAFISWVGGDNSWMAIGLWSILGIDVFMLICTLILL